MVIVVWLDLSSAVGSCSVEMASAYRGRRYEIGYENDDGMEKEFYPEI